MALVTVLWVKASPASKLGMTPYIVEDSPVLVIKSWSYGKLPYNSFLLYNERGYQIDNIEYSGAHKVRVSPVK